MSLGGMPKDWRQLARDAMTRGWTLEQTRGNHVRWTHANGVVHSSLTPSDHRAILRHKSLMRRIESGQLPALVRFLQLFT